MIDKDLRLEQAEIIASVNRQKAIYDAAKATWDATKMRLTMAKEQLRADTRVRLHQLKSAAQQDIDRSRKTADLAAEAISAQKEALSSELSSSSRMVS